MKVYTLSNKKVTKATSLELLAFGVKLFAFRFFQLHLQDVISEKFKHALSGSYF